MMTWLAPLGLIALATLAVPLAIHFLHSPRPEVLDFAALRWLPLRAARRHKPRLHERVLLALRLLLLAVLSALLALPVVHSTGGEHRWVLVAPGVDPASLDADPQAEWHWLASGFPPISESPSPNPAPLASLLRQLDAQLPSATTIKVYVPPQLEGLDAERIKLGRAVDWQIVGSTPVPPPSPALQVAVRADADAVDEVAVVHALIAAWSAQGHVVKVDAQDIATPLGSAQLAFWLSAAEPPPDVDAWVRGGGTLLRRRHLHAEGLARLLDDNAEALLRETPLGAGRVLSVAGPLTPGEQPALHEASMPQRLWTLLAEPPASKLPALAADVAPQLNTAQSSGPRRSLDRVLLMAALLLFIAERVWALRSRPVPA